LFGLVAWLLVGVPSALATQSGLDPQNRVHLGVSVVDGPSPVGISGGFDSRLTRLASVDLGGFASVVPIAEDVGVTVETYPEYLRLRHGVYIAPGLRIPHPQPQAFAYDFFLRVGAGVVWTANLSPDVSGFDTSNYSVLPAPAGLAGADALIRVGPVGARLAGKAWMYEGTRAIPAESFFMLRASASIEGLYQW